MKIKRIVIDICQACLDGEPSECHTPGCALFLHRVDLPIHPELYQVVHQFDDEPTSAQAKADIERGGHGVDEWL